MTASVTRISASSPYARCTLCPGFAIVWADRAKHTTHLITEPPPVVTPPVVTPPVVTPPTTSAPMALPAHVLAAYYMMWPNSPHIRLTDIPANVNTVNLAFMQGAGFADGSWGPYGKAQTIADAATLRARGVRIMLSVGGAGYAVNLTDHAGFIANVKAIAAQMPVDGLDWDVETGAFNAADVVYISVALKGAFGPNFAITMAPNGSNTENYLAIAVQLQKAGALDMFGQQYYDAPVSKEAALGRIKEAVTAGIPQAKISVGMMVAADANHWTVDTCVTNMRYFLASYPGLRGAYLWQAGDSTTADWAARVGAVVLT